VAPVYGAVDGGVKSFGLTAAKLPVAKLLALRTREEALRRGGIQTGGAGGGRGGNALRGMPDWARSRSACARGTG